jgi:hypothetical protein
MDKMVEGAGPFMVSRTCDAAILDPRNFFCVLSLSLVSGVARTAYHSSSKADETDLI